MRLSHIWLKLRTMMSRSTWRNSFLDFDQHCLLRCLHSIQQLCWRLRCWRRGPNTPQLLLSTYNRRLSHLTGGSLDFFGECSGTCRLPPTDKYKQTGKTDRTGREDSQRHTDTAHTVATEQQTIPGNVFTTETSKWYNN